MMSVFVVLVLLSFPIERLPSGFVIPISLGPKVAPVNVPSDKCRIFKKRFTLFLQSDGRFLYIFWLILVFLGRKSLLNI